MTCERAHRNREMTMEIEPGAGAGGRVGGCPKNPRGLFCDYPADTGARRELRRRRGGRGVVDGGRGDQHAGGDGVDAEAGGDEGCPAIQTGETVKWGGDMQHGPARSSPFRKARGLTRGHSVPAGVNKLTVRVPLKATL